MLYNVLYIQLLLILATTAAAATTPYCPENLTKVEYLPILRSHIILLPSVGIFDNFLKKKLINITYFDYEKRISFKLLNKCCMGYRMTLYGICEPICENIRCDQHQYQMCIEPNRCGCENGYKYNDISATQCAPICHDGCQLNEYCRAPNICECMANYTLNVKNKICQARCRPGIEWDPDTLTCVQKLQANIAVIAAEMDILVPDVESSSDNYEGAGDGDPAAFVGIWKNQSVVNTLESCNENGEECGGKYWPTCFFISMGILVILLLVTLVIAGHYFWKRRSSEHIVILEPRNDFYDDYGLDRNQMLVF